MGAQWVRKHTAPTHRTEIRRRCRRAHPGELRDGGPPPAGPPMPVPRRPGGGPAYRPPRPARNPPGGAAGTPGRSGGRGGDPRPPYDAGHTPSGRGRSMTAPSSAATYTIAGRTVAMPCVVRDASAGTAVFEVDRDAARRMVPEPFEPVETAPGRCQLVLAVIDYRDNDLGDYLEVGVPFFVTP